MSKEQDIQYIIEMNRISRLLHKTFFFARQRRAVNHSHKYVIHDKDLKAVATKTAETAAPVDPEVLTAKILDGFDPDNDKMDRRILYEVTGLTLIKDEFIDDDSSDSDGESLAQDLMNTDPLEQAFNYR